MSAHTQGWKPKANRGRISTLTVSQAQSATTASVKQITRSKAQEALAKESMVIYNKWKFFDSMTSMLSMVGFFIAIISYEYELQTYPTLDLPDETREDMHKVAMEQPFFHDNFNKTLRWIAFSTSMASVITVAMRRYFKFIWRGRYLTTKRDLRDDTFTYINVHIDGPDNSMPLVTEERVNLNAKFMEEIKQQTEKNWTNIFLSQFEFLVEVISLAICPLPFYETLIPVYYTYVNGSD